MAEILLTHSYLLRHDLKEFRAMMPYPPLGCLYAAASLRALGCSVALFDSILEDDERRIDASLKLHKPKIVVIYDDDFNYLTKMCLTRMRDAAHTMTRLAKERGCTVVVHGSDPTDHAKEYFRHGADYVIIGEGEQTLTELIGHLARNDGIGSVSGIAYVDGGEIRRTPRRQVETDLDRIPFPSRDLADMKRYAALWRQRHGYFSTNIVTTRGCPFHCNWCAKPIYGQVYHSRSPENVVEEMLLLKREFAPDHLWFCDDIFGLKPGWVREFADTVRQRDAAIPYKCLSRADLLVHDETISDLSRSGCSSVWMGAESGSQRILDAMEKGTTVEQIKDASVRLHAKGLNVGFFLQYGYPGENRDDIERTLQMVKECKPDEIGVSVSYPLPGTKFYERVKQELGDKKNWYDSGDLEMMYHGTYGTEFYRTLHRLTHKKFRIWQGVDMLKDACVHPTSITRATVRRIAASAFHAVTLPGLVVKLGRLAQQESSTQSHS